MKVFFAAAPERLELPLVGMGKNLERTTVLKTNLGVEIKKSVLGIHIVYELGT